MLDVLLMLQAEHGGGNSSTFTCRVLTSSGTDPYSAYSSAICPLKGPRHGGANLKVIHMLDNFKENIRNWNDEGEVADYMRKVIRKEANDGSGLIYGMGRAGLYHLRPSCDYPQEEGLRACRRKGNRSGIQAPRYNRTPYPRNFQRGQGQRQGYVRKRGYVFGSCLQNAWNPRGSVHAPLRRCPYGRLACSQNGGNPHLRQNYTSGLQGNRCRKGICKARGQIKFRHIKHIKHKSKSRKGDFFESIKNRGSSHACPFSLRLLLRLEH